MSVAFWNYLFYNHWHVYYNIQCVLFGFIGFDPSKNPYFLKKMTEFKFSRSIFTGKPTYMSRELEGAEPEGAEGAEARLRGTTCIPAIEFVTRSHDRYLYSSYTHE
jgi:hypothetical protein